MLYRKNGFTLIEVVLTMAISSIIAISLYSFFSGSMTKYFAMQEDSSNFATLSTQIQRIAKVLRGTTDVRSAASTDLTVYAYFSPRDSIPSQIRYYVSGTQLLADVTPLSAAPPTGTPVTAQKKTYTIIYKLYSTTSVFTYLDSAGNTLTSLTNLRDVKGIKTTLSVPPQRGTSTKQTTISLSVSLRNRKTNL